MYQSFLFILKKKIVIKIPYQSFCRRMYQSYIKRYLEKEHDWYFLKSLFFFNEKQFNKITHFFFWKKEKTKSICFKKIKFKSSGNPIIDGGSTTVGPFLSFSS